MNPTTGTPRTAGNRGTKDPASSRSFALPFSPCFHKRKTATQRNAARRAFQEAFFTLVEDRRTCYRDDVIWSKLHPYRQALTDALQANVDSFSLSPSSHRVDPSVGASHLTLASQKVDEEVLLADLSSSSGLPPPPLSSHPQEAVVEDARSSCRERMALHDVIRIAKALPSPAVTPPYALQWDMENDCMESDEKGMFVVDVLLSTVLQHPEDLAIFLTAVFPLPSSAASCSSVSFSPLVYAAILQGLLWVGSNGPSISQHSTSSPSSASFIEDAHGPGVSLDRVRIGNLAGRYMGMALTAFSSTGENSLTVRQMDVVWNAFFVTACMAQMKPKLLDLWWNHMCTFYSKGTQSSCGEGVIDEVDSVEGKAMGAREDEKLMNRNHAHAPTEWVLPEERDSRGQEVHSEGLEETRKQYLEEKSTEPLSFLDLMMPIMSGMEGSSEKHAEEDHVKKGEASVASRSSSASSPRLGKEPIASSRTSTPLGSSFSESFSVAAASLQSRHASTPLPYEAVLGLMAATADNMDIERTVHIFHEVKRRGVRVAAPFCCFSSAIRNGTSPSGRRVEDEKRTPIFPSSSFPMVVSVDPPRLKHSLSFSSFPLLLQEQVCLRLFAKLMACTKYANNEDGGLREVVVNDLQRHVSPEVLCSAPWEVINDLLIGLHVPSAMHLVKVRSESILEHPTQASAKDRNASSHPATAAETKVDGGKQEGDQVSACKDQKQREKRQQDPGEVPFFIWASLLRRCARDHLIDEAEALFSFIQACRASISAKEKKELVTIMVRMYATLSPPDTSDALHVFLEHILRGERVASTAEDKKRNAAGGPMNTGAQETITQEEDEKASSTAHPSPASTPPHQGGSSSAEADESLYSLLIRSADSRNASMMYFLEACAEGISLSEEVFDSLFGSYSYQSSLRSLQKRLPHDYTASKFDTLLRIPTNIDAHLRREEAQREAGQPVVDSTGEAF